MRIRYGMLVALALLLSPGAGNATVLFEFNRISDTNATVTATGTLDVAAPGSNSHILSFRNPFGIAPASAANFTVFTSSTMTIGGTPIDFALLAGDAFGGTGGDPWIYFGKSGLLPLGAGIVTGILELTLSGGATFGPTGATGDVTWGIFTNGNPAGSWTIVSDAVAIGEPGMLILSGAGLFWVAGRKRRLTT